ncbi:MAG: efflux RND transporter periplasmic adaptor subunit [Gammaproteobacteria bacterium]|jgi:HlyD family secretion protein
MDIRKFLLNKTTVVVVVIAAAGAAYLLWHKDRQPAATERYKTERLAVGDITQTVSANGTLNPVVLVSVGTQVSGTVKRLYADFNDHVEQGQILVELDDSLFRAQVKQSEANVNSAQASLTLASANAARTRDLFAQEYVSKQQLDQAEEAVKAAQAQLELSKAQLQKDRTNLSYTIIRSPVSGVVVDRQIDVGQTVAASFQTPTLFKIAQDLRRMQIDTSFAEADVGNIRKAQAVRFSVDAFPDRSFKGVVKQVRLNPTTQQNVVTYDVVVSVDNPDRILLPGMTAYVNITTAQRHKVLLVPNAALRFRPQENAEHSGAGQGRVEGREGNRGTVYVLENQRLKAVPVRTGITDNRFTVVLSGGVKAGDQVVVEDTQLSDSQRSSSRFRMRLF